MEHLTTVALMMSAIGVFMTGLANLINALKPKKEQPIKRTRPRKKR